MFFFRVKDTSSAALFLLKRLLIELFKFIFDDCVKFINVKNCCFLIAAIIQVEITPTVPSAVGLSFGFLTLAGMTTVS
jgi:hypothetical protein